MRVLGDQLELGVRRKDGTMLLREGTPAQIENAIPWLRRQNALGADIFVRPHGSRGLVFVDDLKPAALNQMKRDGLAPAVVIESSRNNYHAWVRVAPHPIPEQEASRAAMLLSRAYGGDPASADWRHFGRLAGFTNQKPERAVDGRQPYVLVREAGGEVAKRGAELLAQARSELLRDESHARVAAIRTVDLTHQATSKPGLEPARDYRSRAHAILKAYPNPDWSRVDWMISKDMAREGRTPDFIAEGIRSASPNLEARRHRPDYPERTAAKATAEVAKETAPAREAAKIKTFSFDR